MPPLRERGADILLLARHFLAVHGARYGKPGLRLSATTERALAAHSWPGNVRELRNVVEQAVLLAAGPTLGAAARRAAAERRSAERRGGGRCGAGVLAARSRRACADARIAGDHPVEREPRGAASRRVARHDALPDGEVPASAAALAA